MTGASGDISLLLSKDGSRLAQSSTYDIAGDPVQSIPLGGQTGPRRASDSAVIVVGFDDLECPFCAQLNHEMFPALTDHYKDL